VDLFERRRWLLTPTAATPRVAVERLSRFVRALGATPVEIDPDLHDHVLAYTSHLPQLTSTALMHVVGEAVGTPGLQWSGAGLADTTRIAASPGAVWSDICQTNADEILPALDRVIAALTTLRRDLAEGRPVEPMFDSARRWRSKIG
jgi:prephenate dehydrogenase